MLIDPLRLGGNIPVRWLERTLNIPQGILREIDKGEIMPGSSTAKNIGETIGEQITGQPAAPRKTASESIEELTGAKLPAIPDVELPRPFEYQTDKYKADGKTGEDVGATAVDVLLLKRGIVGKPNVTPESLKTLGGIPKEVNSAAHTPKVAQIGEIQSTKSVSKSAKTEFREVEIVDKKGRSVGEFDRIESGLFVEEKSARGLSTLHPKTGKPVQTAGQWARKQIFEKTVTRIKNLKNEATSTRATKNGSIEISSLQEIKSFRKLEFRIEGDTPALRKAVSKELQELSQKYPDWKFTAEFGK